MDSSSMSKPRPTQVTDRTLFAAVLHAYRCTTFGQAWRFCHGHVAPAVAALQARPLRQLFSWYSTKLQTFCCKVKHELLPPTLTTLRAVLRPLYMSLQIICQDGMPVSACHLLHCSTHLTCLLFIAYMLSSLHASLALNHRDCMVSTCLTFLLCVVHPLPPPPPQQHL